MKNLKKVLSLVLALAMALSLMTAAFAADASEYTDYNQIDDTYAEAVSVLTGLGVMEGTSTTSFTFSPNQTITRAEMAAILYRVVTGDVEDEQDQIYAGYAAKEFSDVKADAWYAGYVGYCANQELILGDGNGHFYPLTKINGYQVLAMVLRAVGYDANKEFQGAGWEIRVASTANQTGVTKNIKETSLSSATPREQVAEMVFQALVATPIVNYNANVGYQPRTAVADVNIHTGVVSTTVKGQTLGVKTFSLKQTYLDKIDDWGRPGYIWYQDLNKTAGYQTSTKDVKVATIKIAPSASYTVKVDECDIAEDLGLKKSADIEKAYIDGVNTTKTNSAVTTDRNGKIDPLATTSLVGAQGRLTEVYDLGDDGYRIVEINTYLAKVTKVTAATTDKNGHVTAGYSTLEVYTNGIAGAITPYLTSGSTRTLYSTDTSFAKGSYVLVTANEVTLGKKTSDNKVGLVATIEAAAVTPTGAQTSWTNAVGTTPATTTVGATTFNDADKFVLGRVKGLNAGNWDTIVDQYGNLIGMVPSTVNYLIIEKIEWEDTLGVVGGGYALADVVLADGAKATVKVSKVNTNKVTNTNVAVGAATSGTVADEYQNNTSYYNHIYTYTVNADDTYTLVGYCYDVNNASQATSHNTAQVTITTGKTSTIQNNTNTVVANDNTVFLVADKLDNTGAAANGTTYTAYYGVDNVPSMTVAQGGLCYVSDGTYATLVVVNNYTLASSEFVAYAATQNGYAVGYDNNNAIKYAYEVYQAGSTEPIIIYSNTQNLFAADGFYRIKVDNDKKVVNTTTSTNPYFVLRGFSGSDAGSTNNAYGDLYWARGQVGAFDGNGLVVTKYDGATQFADYRTDNSTTYLQVTKTIYADGLNTTEKTSVSTITADQIGEEDRVIVAYTKTNAGEKVATYVYVLKTVSNGVNIQGNINKINVYIDGIVAGNDIADTIATLSTNINGVYVPNSVVWEQHSAAGDSWTPCTDNNIFVSGYTYRAVITTTAPSGYEFANSVTLTNGSVNGLPNSTVSGTANRIVFQFVMP